MCGIIAWVGSVPRAARLHALGAGTRRGRDGYGIGVGGRTYRGLGRLAGAHLEAALEAESLVANFRATPTTEIESGVDLLQPYDGIVHNGTIANDKELAATMGLPPPLIDSMILPDLLGHPRPSGAKALAERLAAIEGSFALAYVDGDALMVAANYKPLYYRRWPRGVLACSTREMVGDGALALTPYTAARLTADDKAATASLYSRDPDASVVVAASAGLDSTTVAYVLRDRGMRVTLAHFDYGALAAPREREAVEKIAAHGRFRLVHIALPRVFAGTLVDGQYHRDGVRGAEYAEDWISARNLLMASVLIAYAESNGIGHVALGNNLEEAGAYPDNEEEFGVRLGDLLPYALQRDTPMRVLQPLAQRMKHEVVKMGLDADVPYHLTWSCYGSGDEHCGECGPCFMRRTAFARNGILDPAFAGAAP